jgi:hypothetical protein
MCNAAEINPAKASEAAMRAFLNASAAAVVGTNVTTQELFAQSAFNIYAECLAAYRNFKQEAGK